MTTTATPTMQRKAETLAAQASTWVRGRLKLNGVGFFVIPGSEPGTVHWANRFACDCPSYVHRGACSHVEACKLLAARADAAIVQKVQAEDERRQRAYEALFPADDMPTTVRIARPCAIRGCPVEAGTDSEMCPMHAREQRAAIVA